MGPLNEYVRERIRAVLQGFKSSTVYAPDPDHLPLALGYELNASFSVALLNSDLVSIRFSFDAYAGGAHGFPWMETVNAFLNPYLPIGLENLFADIDLGIKVLSSYCIGALLHSTNQGVTRDEEWVRSGSGTEAKNFSRFNLRDQGLLITFDTYQIDGYAAGPSEVLVPYTVFAGNLDSRIVSALSIQATASSLGSASAR